MLTEIFNLLSKAPRATALAFRNSLARVSRSTQASQTAPLHVSIPAGNLELAAQHKRRTSEQLEELKGSRVPQSFLYTSITPPATSSNTCTMSENASRRGMETYEALRGNQSSSYMSHDGRHADFQGVSAGPIQSWHQISAAVLPTARDQLGSQYISSNGTPYQSSHSIYQHQGYNASGIPALDAARSTPAPSPSISGVNATSCIPYQHLNNCYAYALDRGNGRFTRLIPADCLPSTVPLPRLQSAEGLIILSAPRGQPPPEAFWNNTYEGTQPMIGMNRQFSHSGDAVQSTIDNIVANLPQAPRKRTKIYCDKWLHEGVCAFAQQGCRYKHEMPMDKATQHSVGLFNGLPKWFKAKHADELPEESPTVSTRVESPPRSGRTALLAGGSWRAGVGRGGGVTMQQKQITPPSQRAIYNSRSTGSPTASSSWRGDPLQNGDTSNRTAPMNGRLESTGNFPASPNAYDLLFELDETEIDDGEV